MDDTGKQQGLPDDDYVVYVPMEDIQAIERVISQLEQVREEFRKIVERSNPDGCSGNNNE